MDKVPPHEALLQQLSTRFLDIEAEASALILEAGKEVDERIAESENEGRSLFDKKYAAQAVVLNDTHDNNILSFREDYQKKLDNYKKELLEKPVNTEAFFTLAGKLLMGSI
jgi:hypothetical protein